MIAYKLVVGDTLSYRQAAPTGADGPFYPADGWTLKYRLVPLDVGGSAIDITATTDGDGYRIAQPASVTVNWAAGVYTAAAWVEKGVEKYTVEPAFTAVQILPNPRTMAPGFDGRTQAQKALDDLNEARANYAATNGTVAEYEIAGRRMRFRAVEQFDLEIKYWQGQRAKEIREGAIARGLADPRFSYTRFDGHGS